MKTSLSEVIVALHNYLGPFDDPHVGWIGQLPSHPNMFRCERCGAEGEDSTEIPHAPDCSAKALYDILVKLDKPFK